MSESCSVEGIASESRDPLSLTPQKQKQKTLEVLLAWFLREAEKQPVYFVMEDLHWADPSTLELISLLIEPVPAAGSAHPWGRLPGSTHRKILSPASHPVARPVCPFPADRGAP